MKDVYKLFYKSCGGESTSNIPVDYHTIVGEIEADNLEELGKIATDIIEGLGLPLDNFSIDIINEQKQYGNATATGGEAEKYFTNHTGKS